MPQHHYSELSPTNCISSSHLTQPSSLKRKGAFMLKTPDRISQGSTRSKTDCTETRPLALTHSAKLSVSSFRIDFCQVNFKRDISKEGQRLRYKFCSTSGGEKKQNHMHHNELNSTGEMEGLKPCQYALVWWFNR